MLQRICLYEAIAPRAASQAAIAQGAVAKPIAMSLNLLVLSLLLAIVLSVFPPVAVLVQYVVVLVQLIRNPTAATLPVRPTNATSILCGFHRFLARHQGRGSFLLFGDGYFRLLFAMNTVLYHPIDTLPNCRYPVQR